MLYKNIYRKNAKKLAFIGKIGYNNKVNKKRQKSGSKSHSCLVIKGGYTLANIEEKVESLIKPKIENIGYELYDVEYSKEGKNYYLRVFIDKPKGIDLTDCEKVNDEINDILDEANYIKEQYFLEVSSPGIERILRKDKHLEKNIGTEINIKLFKKDENGNKEYQGILKSFNENEIELEDDIKIERKNIAQIKTIYHW